MLSMRIVKPSPTRTKRETYPWICVHSHGPYYQSLLSNSTSGGLRFSGWLWTAIDGWGAYQKEIILAMPNELNLADSSPLRQLIRDPHQGPLSVSPVILVWATACLLPEKLSLISNLGVELQMSLGYFWSSSDEGACWEFFILFFFYQNGEVGRPTRPRFPTPRSIIIIGIISELRGILGSYALDFTYPWSLLLPSK